MEKTKPRNASRRNAVRTAKTGKRPFEPLFVGLDDGTIPQHPSGPEAERLRKNMAAWSTYITRLTSHSSHGMDDETKQLVVWAHLHRGVAHIQFQEWQQAKCDFDTVVALDVGQPENNTARWYRALAHDLLGYDEQAIEDWTHVLLAFEQAPPQVRAAIPRAWPPHAYACRARLSCKKGNYTRAIADCDRAIHIDPMCAEAYSVRGTAYKYTGHLDQALADCTKAIELAEGAVHYYRRGLISLQQRNYSQAIQDLDRALELEPGRAQFQDARRDALLLSLFRLEL